VFGTFDDDFFAGRRSVGDASASTGAATNGFDPFAIRSGVNRHGISGPGNRSCFTDGKIWTALITGT